MLSRPIKGKNYKAGRSYIGPAGPNVSGKGKSSFEMNLLTHNWPSRHKQRPVDEKVAQLIT